MTVTPCCPDISPRYEADKQELWVTGCGRPYRSRYQRRRELSEWWLRRCFVMIVSALLLQREKLFCSKRPMKLLTFPFPRGMSTSASVCWNRSETLQWWILLQCTFSFYSYWFFSSPSIFGDLVCPLSSSFPTPSHIYFINPLLWLFSFLLSSFPFLLERFIRFLFDLVHS